MLKIKKQLTAFMLKLVIYGLLKELKLLSDSWTGLLFHSLFAIRIYVQFSINYFSKFRVPEWRRRILNRKVLSICRFIWKIFSRKAFVYYRETVPVWPQFNWQFLLKMNNLSTYTNNLSLSKIKTNKTSKTIKTL